ncbi:MAG: LrgB family protein [Ectothiorhodospiraceae bacterium]|nr:LrgB family protein [Ectothiorhodospiraceae bacterium]
MLYDAVDGLRAYLAASPLAWLFATVAAYLLARSLFQRARQHPFVNPIVVAILLLGAVLWLTGVDYADYFAGAQFIHFLLGPVTVLLAVPLYKALRLVRRAAIPLAVALPVGSLVASLPAVVLAALLGASDAVARALATKSVSTPIALGVSEAVGGLTAITAVVVVFTGVLGGMMSGVVFRAFRVRSPAAQGFALGLTAHGIGIGRAVQIDDTAAAFASVAMGLNGLVTALWVPALVPVVLATMG